MRSDPSWIRRLLNRIHHRLSIYLHSTNFASSVAARHNNPPTDHPSSHQWSCAPDGQQYPQRWLCRWGTWLWWRRRRGQCQLLPVPI